MMIMMVDPCLQFERFPSLLPVPVLFRHCHYLVYFDYEAVRILLPSPTLHREAMALEREIENPFVSMLVSRTAEACCSSRML
jgi:hypothetical protein